MTDYRKVDYRIVDRAVRNAIYDTAIVDGDMPHPDLIAVKAMAMAVDAGVPAGFALRHGHAAAMVRCTIPRFFRCRRAA